MPWLNWAIVVLGVWLMLDGLRAIGRGRVNTNLGRFEGSKAALVGWIWIIVGLLLFWGGLSNVAWLKAFIAAFLQAA